MYKNNVLKKGFIFEIILLFIGLSFTSSINSYTIKTGIQSNVKSYDNSPLNIDQYILGYWKFDEGSGNIAYDSSGHEYDGTINGATWTTGYSGYALSFDGIDDYIILDDYAQNFLGFNKTDDLIFSLYFRSISTSSGVIYSVSYSTDYNPGVQIALNSNGTLEFRVWRLSCGIQLTSKGTYNDGDWHYVEIYYNGISAEPTVELYVDNEFDCNITHWVCAFYSDQFYKAKIGTRSYDPTNYFKGSIDEVKIIKYPKGNEQVPPSIDGPIVGVPGVKYNYTFVTNDPEEDDIWLYVDWGDGSNTGWNGPYTSGEEVIKSHTWDENGAYDIKAKSKDYWHQSRSSDPYQVRIGNQAPDAPTINGSQFGEAGVSYEYIFTATDFECDDLYYWIDWGDGQNEYWLGPYITGEEVIKNHTWAENGIYEIKAKVKDAYAESVWSSLLVIIGNQPPNKPDILGPTSGKVGTMYTYTFVSVDPNGDDIFYEIDWGDGQVDPWDGPHKSNTIITKNHIWKRQGTFTIRARAKDAKDAIGEWGALVVIMPKNLQIIKQLILSQPLLFWLLQRFFVFSSFF
jgi:hypothetical protein